MNTEPALLSAAGVRRREQALAELRDVVRKRGRNRTVRTAALAFALPLGAVSLFVVLQTSAMSGHATPGTSSVPALTADTAAADSGRAVAHADATAPDAVASASLVQIVATDPTATSRLRLAWAEPASIQTVSDGELLQALEQTGVKAGLIRTASGVRVLNESALLDPAGSSSLPSKGQILLASR